MLARRRDLFPHAKNIFFQFGSVWECIFLLEDKCLFLLSSMVELLWGKFFATVRHTCSIHFLATYHQLFITIRPNLPGKHGGYRIPESWLKALYFLGFY